MAISRQSVHILHLEDSSLDADMASEYLSSGGIVFSIERVWTRDDFKSSLLSGSFDLIIADHQLPAFDGHMALDMARTISPDVPFIFLSGTLGEDIAVEALKLGAADYVTKQRMDRLPMVVQRVLTESADRKARQAAESQLRESEARLSFLDRLNSEVSNQHDANYVLEITTRRLGEHLTASVCAYADMDADEDGFTIRGDWHAEGTHTIVGSYKLSLFGTKAVDALRAGNALVLHDIPTELPWHEARTFTDLGLAATICMPLIKGGRLTALMAVHDNTARNWTEYEVRLVKEVVDRSWAHVERVRDQQLAHQSAERLALATKAAGIGTWDFNPVTGELRWDERCKALFGLNPQADVTYESVFLAGVHPDDRERAHEAVQMALSPYGTRSFDIEYRTIGIEDGLERWVVARGQALFRGDVATRFIGTVIDITAQKKAEHDLATLNSTGATIARELDLERIVQKVTDAGVELTGAKFGAFFYNVLDEKGESYMLYSLSGVSRSAFANFPMPRNTAIFEPTFSGSGVMRSDDITKDTRYGHNDPHHGMPAGHLPVRSYLAVPVISRNGEVLGGLFFGHDEPAKFKIEHETALLGIAGHAATSIDNSRLFAAASKELADRRRAEAELQELNATLEQRVANEIAERSRTEDQLRQIQKMEAVGQLTGGIAHDFNNMLAVIMGGLNLAQRRLQKGDSRISKYIDGAMEGASRAASLTQRLLAFSRQQPLSPELVDANDIVSGMTELLQRTLGETIQIDTQLSETVCLVRVDVPQFENAILNLAVNARDAMPNGGRLSILIRCLSADNAPDLQPNLPAQDLVMIAVQDTGCGMPHEVASKAFDPFFTTKEVGKGTGLGLSQVFGLVRQSGGEVRLSSIVGKGTRISIYLPRQTGTLSKVEVAKISTTELTGGETILSVEDDARVRLFSSEALRELGYTVIEVEDPRQALTILDSGQHVDLLFTDVVMPHLSGRELADQAKLKRPSLKVLFTTGYERNPDAVSSELLLTKPYTVDALAEKLRSALAK